jgi:predicted DNA-binding transcriptional regulator AlpA
MANHTQPQTLHMEPPPLAAPDSLLDPHATAKFLGGVSILTLADWRTKGVGPAYVKVGRCVRYRLSDLQTWLESRTRKGA